MKNMSSLRFIFVAVFLPVIVFSKPIPDPDPGCPQPCDSNIHTSYPQQYGNIQYGFPQQIQPVMQPIRLQQPVVQPVPLPQPALQTIRISPPVSFQPVQFPQQLQLPQSMQFSQQIPIPQPVQISQPIQIPQPVQISQPIPVPQPVQMPQPMHLPQPVVRPAPFVLPQYQGNVNFGATPCSG